MKYIKSYNIFTPFPHRLVLHLLIPALGVLLSLCLMLVLRESAEAMQNAHFFSMAYISGFLAIYAAVADGRVFGGSMRKGESRIDYLKCSERGTAVYRDALIGDQMIRLLTVFLAVGLSALLSVLLLRHSPQGMILSWLQFSAFAWMISQTGICMGRLLKFEAQIGIAVTCILVMGMVATLLMMNTSPLLQETALLPLSAFCLLSGLLLGVWMVRQSVKKKGEEYHDC